jgi:hypothetical protein
VTVTNDLLERQIDEIERAVLLDDPAFARHFRMEAPDTGHETLVFLLLVASALLLAVGLTTLAPVAWFAGSAAFVASSVVDARHQRKLALIRS